jgi:hypothetical protein
MAVGVGAAIDTAPGPALSFTARVGGTNDRWSLATELRGDLPASHESLGGRAIASLMAALVVACRHHRAIAFCAVVGAGGQEVSGSGYLAARSFWVPWAALGGRVELTLPLSHQLALALRVDVLAPVTRTQLEVGVGRPFVVYQTPPVCNTFGIALSNR